jgi:hypothetical protein
MNVFITRVVVVLLSSMMVLNAAGAEQGAAAPPVDKTGAAKQTETIKLAITPAAEATPLLKYRLTPRFADQRPGNAAPLYAQAALTYQPTEADEKRIAELLKASPAEFAKFAAEKNGGTLVPVTPVNLLRVAARREECRWDHPLREQNPFSVLMPEQQQLRKLARLVALRARLHGTRKEYEEAIEMIAVGYMMAHHEGKTPVLIGGLVGVSIARVMDEVVLDLAQRPGAPNLYWALTTRPQPLVEFRPALEAESSALDLSLPILNAAVHKEPGSMDWDAGLDELAEMLQLVSGISEENEPTLAKLIARSGRSVMLAGVVAVKGKGMRDYLVARGLPRERVERMGSTQLVLAHEKLKYDEHRDRMFAWMSLPYPQARAGLEEAEKRLKQATRDGETTYGWGGMMLPAVASVHGTHARAERAGDVLRLIEALRLYAAEHAGALPKTLADVQAKTPLPADCVTGEPFRYASDGATATLTLPPNRAGADAIVYEFSVAK